MLRKLCYFLIVIVVLLLLAAAAVQIVFMTDLPRQLVVDALRDQTGLNINIGSLKTGWGGDTRVRNVTATLPLEDTPFLDVPELSIEHTGVIKLILMRPFTLDDVKIFEPEVTLREDEDGVWNLQRALTVIQRTQAKKPQDEPGGGLGQLPMLLLKNATIRVNRYQQDEFVYEPLVVEGEPAGTLAWKFDAAYQQAIGVSGRLVPRPPMYHEIAFELKDLQPLLEPWLQQSPPDLYAKGEWLGETTADGISGKLIIDKVAAMDNTVDGEVMISTSGSTATIHPKSLVIQPVALGEKNITVTDGAISANNENISIKELIVFGMGTTAALDGKFMLGERTGELHATWTGKRPESELTHQGTLTVSAKLQPVGPLEITTRVVGDGKSKQGEFQVAMEADAQGESFTNFTAGIAFPELIWRDGQGKIDYNGLALSEITLADSVVSIDSLTLPHAETAAAQGMFNLKTNAWEAAFNAEKWRLPRNLEEPITAKLAAAGDMKAIEFSKLKVTSDRITVQAAGDYLREEEIPLIARASVTIRDPMGKMTGSTAEAEQIEEAEKRPPGKLQADVNVEGSVYPPDITYAGDLVASNLEVAGGEIERLEVPWRGRVTDTISTFDTDIFELLGGQWQVAGTYSNSEQLLTLDLDTKAVPLDQVVELSGLPLNVAGVLGADVDLRLPEMNTDKLEVEGSWEVSDLSRGRLAANTGGGRIEVREGNVKLSDIRLQQGDGLIEGELGFNLNEGRHLLVDLKSTDWPVSLENAQASALLDLLARLKVDIKDQTAEGNIDLAADLSLGDQPAGQLTLDSSVRGKTVTLKSIGGVVLSGTLNGSGVVPVDELLETKIDLQWDGLQLDQLARYVPNLKDLRGTANGSLAVGQTTEKRQPEPLRISLVNRVEDGDIRDLSIGDIDMLAFAGPDRQLLDRFAIELAGGTLEIWGRTSMHKKQRYGHTYITFDDLDLNQIVQMASPEASELQARISGNATAGGYFSEPHRMFGSGDIEIAQADLGNVPLLAQLYDLLSLKIGSPDPTGEGSGKFRLEGDAFEITSFEYFNRGVDAFARLTVKDIWKGAESPIDGLAVGTLRPLRDLELPLVGELDAFVQAIQIDAATIRIDGTLGSAEYRAVPFAEVGSSLQRMLKATLSE